MWIGLLGVCGGDAVVGHLIGDYCPFGSSSAITHNYKPTFSFFPAFMHKNPLPECCSLLSPFYLFKAFNLFLRSTHATSS